MNIYGLEFPPGVMADLGSFLLGARIRQLRVKDGYCRIPDMIKDYFPDCLGSYSMISDDTSDYEVGWKKKEELNSTRNWNEIEEDKEAPNDAFKYKSAMELAGDPITLELATYR